MIAEPTSVISVIASVVSAVGAAAACIAAFRSAGHAKEAFDEIQKTEKRFSLRQLSLTAHEVSVEVDRIKWVAQKLILAYQTLAVFSGRSGGSLVSLCIEEVDKKVEIADALQTKAKPFIELQTALLGGPFEEIAGREVAMSQYLAESIALREKVELELSEVQAQNTTHREIAINNAKGNHA